MATLWQYVPILAAAAAMLALAGWLLWLDFGRTANRVFAALLALRAGTFILGAWRGVAGPDAQGWLTAFAPTFIIPLLPLTLYLVSVHPRRRGPLARRGGAWLLAAGTAAAIVWAWLDPAAYAVTAPDSGGVYALGAGPDRAYTAFGPLILFTALRLPVFAFAAVVFARDYVGASEPTRRHSALLLYAGFGLNAYFDGANALASLPVTLQDPGMLPWTPWGWAYVLLPTASLLLALASTAVLIRGQLAPRQGARRGVRGALIASGVAFASGIAVAQGAASTLPGGEKILVLVLGLWRLALPLLVTYALLRYSLFDVDVRMKRGLGKGTVVAVFVLLLVLASEVVENLVAQSQGQVFGFVAAAIMTVTFRPVEGVGVRVAERMLPDVKPIQAQSPGERRRFYQDHVVLAVEDGRLTPKERVLLDELATRLGIRPGTARRLEEQVMG